jgi:hypothetical protein
MFNTESKPPRVCHQFDMDVRVQIIESNGDQPQVQVPPKRQLLPCKCPDPDSDCREMLPQGSMLRNNGGGATWPKELEKMGKEAMANHLLIALHFFQK